MVETARPCQRADIETHIMPDGTCLLFDPVANEGRALNAAGALVWDYCDGTLSTDEIAAELAALLPDEPHMHAETLALLQELERMGYLVASQHTTDPLSSPGIDVAK
ncbi:MAG: PqqD family protein [Ktedonobacterales bacterium]